MSTGIVETHLGQLEYRERGDGPPVVLIHHALGAGDHWDRVVDLLADRYRCIAPDIPLGAHRVPADAGADLTPPGLARAVAQLIEDLDLHDVTLLGNDTGGAIAQIVAANHPERIARVVLNGSDMYDEFPPRIFSYFKLIGIVPGAVWVLGQSLRLKSAWGLPFAFGRLAHRLDRELIAQWGDTLRGDRRRRRDVKAVIRGIDTRHTNEAAEKLRTSGTPILLAWGADDRAFDIENARRMARENPTARLETVEDSGAFVCWDQPARLAELIDKFVAEA